MCHGYHGIGYVALNNKHAYFMEHEGIVFLRKHHAKTDII